MSGKQRGNMSEKNTRKKIVTIKDSNIKNFKIKSLGTKPFIIKNLTLRNVRLIFKLPPEKKE
jgi:hypothetical protein